MSDLLPKAPIRTTGLSPKEQKLQALREKLAKADKAAAKPSHTHGAAGSSAKTTNAPARKAAFQRKAT